VEDRHVDFDAVFGAQTKFCSSSIWNPALGCKVNGFSDVKALVEASVVGSWSCYDKLVFKVLHLVHFYSIFHEKFWVDKGILVSQELRAHFLVLSKLEGSEVLEVFVAIQVNRVPDLGLSFVKVVNGVEVHVFFVPTKHGFP
jgi:hypothetical protein